MQQREKQFSKFPIDLVGVRIARVGKGRERVLAWHGLVLSRFSHSHNDSGPRAELPTFAAPAIPDSLEREAAISGYRGSQRFRMGTPGWAAAGAHTFASVAKSVYCSNQSPGLPSHCPHPSLWSALLLTVTCKPFGAETLAS